MKEAYQTIENEQHKIVVIEWPMYCDTARKRKAFMRERGYAKAVRLKNCTNVDIDARISVDPLCRFPKITIKDQAGFSDSDYRGWEKTV